MLTRPSRNRSIDLINSVISDVFIDRMAASPRILLSIEIVDGEIDVLDVRSIDGVTTCDFLMPPSMKVERNEEGKFNLNLTTHYNTV